MDFRLVTRFCRGPSDFVEGVRALLIDKCGQPRWDPPSIDQARAAARPGGGARPVGQAACAPSLSVIPYLHACGACIIYWIVVRKGNLSASASSPPGLCSSSAFWPASLSGAGRLVACTLRHSAVTQRRPPAQVDPERVAEFFKPLPPDEELQLHEPHILLEHSSKL